MGEGAFAFSFLLTVAIRLTLLRRAGRGAIDPVRLSRYLLALAIADLTVLYIAVAAMVVKPADACSSVARYGGFVIAVGLLTAAVVAYGARTPTTAPGRRLGAPTFRDAVNLIHGAEAEARHLYAIEQESEAGETPALAIAGLVLFILFPAYLVMLGLTAAAYYPA